MKHDETITLDGDGGRKNTDHIWLVVEPNPSEKSWSELVSWDDDIPNMMGKIIQPCSKPLTNQTRYW
jgi:hypothetical protein